MGNHLHGDMVTGFITRACVFVCGYMCYSFSALLILVIKLSGQKKKPVCGCLRLEREPNLTSSSFPDNVGRIPTAFLQMKPSVCICLGKAEKSS